MANKASPLPNFRDVRTKRAIVTGAIATAVGIVVIVPVYNKVLAPTVSRVVDQVKAAGFLPSA